MWVNVKGQAGASWNSIQVVFRNMLLLAYDPEKQSMLRAHGKKVAQANCLPRAGTVRLSDAGSATNPAFL